MNHNDAIHWWQTLDYDNIYNQCVNAISNNNLEKYIELHRMTSEEYSKIINYEIYQKI